MNVLVMDVEGTDGRERGEDQACGLHGHSQPWSDTCLPFRTLSANLPSSRWPSQRSLSSTFGSTRSACTKAQTWDCSRRCLRSTWDSF